MHENLSPRISLTWYFPPLYVSNVGTSAGEMMGIRDQGWRMKDGGWRMEDGGWRMEDEGWRMEDGG